MGESAKANYTFSIVKICKKLGLNDVRRLVHASKVGLALTLSSLLVLVQEPYSWIGQNAIWAVITVVVVFETSAGATLSRGFNRGAGTVLAGILALGFAHLADLFHEPGEPICIGITVFFAGSICTFVRAIPKVKAKFDYGIVIFMLTFCMVLIIGYRIGDEVTTASDRLLTILIGALICLLVSLIVIPHWAGADLHKLVSDNFDKLAEALTGCVEEYLDEDARSVTDMKIYVQQPDDDPVYKKCREAVKSRMTEEALVNFARWEPPHGRFGLGHPWKEYLKVGAMLRHCAYTVLALHGCLRSEIQAPRGLRILFADELRRASKEAAKLLHELGSCIRTLRKPSSPPLDLIRQATHAADEVNECIRKYSYLLSTPERWTAMEENLHSKTIQNLGNADKSKLVRLESLATSLRTVEDRDTLQSSLNSTMGSKYKGSISCGKVKPLGAACPSEERQLIKVNSTSPQSADKSLGRLDLDSSASIKLQIAEELKPVAAKKQDVDGARVLSLVTFASLLVEMLARLEHVVQAVEQLSQRGHFKVREVISSVDEDSDDSNLPSRLELGENDGMNSSKHSRSFDGSSSQDGHGTRTKKPKSLDRNRHLPTGLPTSIE
ncbi:aluminum-activated malate transporter family protein [Marchantia polymorpha subsp. ruderalis]|uniref:Aluminum-activated malate transporter n=2 Tax=Marchantia polymorpha TaxID=3197 RepID=A0AAF6B4P5_MARPO|nr:hypothetical protein MARPO_0100s0061 [Marchantia polymorpha]BBN06979.1 hypothetical protein Mp_3g25480 [Marchantia polymorpha subsp. ruderalis]|eukprot:PTQ32357.1 hypothetical protein MARPO_0100s0061 [Marchantia polymorpha]